MMPAADDFLFLFTYWQVMPFRAYHTSAHGGVSANGLPDTCLIFLNYSVESLEIMFEGRATAII